MADLRASLAADSRSARRRVKDARRRALRKQLALLDARKAAALHLARAKALARQEAVLREQQDAIEAAKAQRLVVHVKEAAALARMEAEQREKEIVRATRDQLTQIQATIAEGKLNQQAARDQLDLQAQIVRARLQRRAAEQIKKIEQDYLRVDASPEAKDSEKRDIAAANALWKTRTNAALKAEGAKLLAVAAEEHAQAAAKEATEAEVEAHLRQAETESSEAAEDEEDE